MRSNILRSALPAGHRYARRAKYARRALSLLIILTLCLTMLTGCRKRPDVPVEDDPKPTPQETPRETPQPTPQPTPKPTPQETPQNGGQETASAAERFDEILDELFAETVTLDSITLNYFVADISRFGIEPIEPTYGEVTSPETIKRDAEDNRELYDKLVALPYEELRDDQKIMYDMLIRNIELYNKLGENDDYNYYLSDIHPVSGMQVQLPILLAEYNFRSAEDIDTYLQLLGDTQRYFDELIVLERERSRRGFFMRKANTDEVIANCENYLEQREDNLLILFFNDMIDGFEGLSDNQRKEYKQRNRELVLDNVLASYDKLLDAMKELRNQGAQKGGLSILPGGKDFAAAYLQYTTGSDRTPEEVGELLELEYNDVIATIRAIFSRRPDIMEGYYNSALGKIRDEKPETYLRQLEKIIERDYPEIEPVQYVVREVSKSLQDFISPAFYLLPALDSFYNNVIYVNPSAITDNISLFTTLAHEGYPGHLYQRVYFLQKSPHPLRTLLGVTGYTEGWATYVELESFYFTDLSEDEAELLRCSYLHNILLISRVDLGVNALGWELGQTGSFLSTQGISEKSTVEEIFNMVTADPLSYLPYSLGYLEFKALLGSAQSELGKNFNIKEFHRFVLDVGPAPFALVNSLMQDWMKTQTSGSLAPAA